MKRIMGMISFTVLVAAIIACSSHRVPSPSVILTPQLALSDLINSVRGSVVKIVVVRLDLKETQLPPLVTCPFTHTTCVAGTGFFVNNNGDVVTAAHVVDGVQEVVRQLAAIHIEAVSSISI